MPNSQDCPDCSLERIVIAAYDLDEMVDLLALNRPFEGPVGQTIARKVATLPLREAVALVVEGWADDKFRPSDQSQPAASLGIQLPQFNAQ